MSFGRKGAAPDELDISGAAHVLRGSREFLRMWAQPGGAATCLIDPSRLGADPALFGIALVDCVRHGARAWAAATGAPEEEALARIWAMIDAERAAPTDHGQALS